MSETTAGTAPPVEGEGLEETIYATLARAAARDPDQVFYIKDDEGVTLTFG